ncbi:MAG: Dps family protein [Rhodospirillaceae bacterium]
MTDLLEAMNSALADTFAFYFRAHSFHWNVSGPRFSQLHSFFGDIYSDTFDAVDGLAEHIRTMSAPAPPSLAAIIAPATVGTGGTDVPDAEAMVGQLLADNDVVTSSLSAAQSLATAAALSGLANYLQERVDRHRKWGWMLSATVEPRPSRREVLYDNKDRLRGLGSPLNGG